MFYSVFLKNNVRFEWEPTDFLKQDVKQLMSLMHKLFERYYFIPNVLFRITERERVLKIPKVYEAFFLFEKTLSF